MSDFALQEIHRLQKDNVSTANKRLLRFLNDELRLPFVVQSVELKPSAVSLNSINGVLYTKAGARKFFKTHIEPGSIIGEYYNVGLLQKAGYPIIAPVFASTDYGRQFLIYDYFDAPSVFDVVHSVELGQRKNAVALLEAQQASDDQLFEIYSKTLRPVDAETHAEQPVHQLFLHRLAGQRIKDFYDGDFVLPQHQTTFSALAAKKWIINGVAYKDTLQDIIDRSILALRFDDHARVLAIAGHGDAHAGNLFYLGPDKPLTYFDPAFAGWHSPLLDVIKPLIHNSLLKWLYFPNEVAALHNIRYDLTDNCIDVEYDFRPSELRQAFFDSKLRRVVLPMLKLLRDKGGLPFNWQNIFQGAAMCCPLLTMNLADRKRFKPGIGLLGLAMSVDLGGRAEGSSKKGWLEQRLSEANL